MKPMPPELRRVFRPMLITMGISFLVMLLSVAGIFYAAYHFLAVEGHSQEDDLPTGLSVTVWGSLATEIIAAVIFTVAGVVILRAGFLRWWPWKGLVQIWRERHRQQVR